MFNKDYFKKGWNANKGGQDLTTAATNSGADAGSAEFHRFVEGFRAADRDTNYVAPTVADVLEAIDA